jgi:hypothetical protein
MAGVSSDPGPPAKPPRSALTVRDMLGALVVLVLVVLVAGGISRSCTFAPTGPTVDASRLPVVDAPAELARLAPDSSFPLRVPAVPADWRANAVDRTSLPEGGRTVRIGYLTPDGRYLRLQQGDASEEAMLRAEAGAAAPGQGVVDVDGQRWVALGTHQKLSGHGAVAGMQLEGLFRGDAPGRAETLPQIRGAEVPEGRIPGRRIAVPVVRA